MNVFWNRLRFFTALWALCGFALGLLACAPQNAPNRLSQVTMQIEMNRDVYRPGEAVLCTATLTNSHNMPVDIMIPDYLSTQFTYCPRKQGGLSQAIAREPVYSNKETIGAWTTLEPGQSVSKAFVFTTLTFERGEFLLNASYGMPNPENPELTDRAFAQSLAFDVRGQDVYIHRYVDGLMTKEDAIQVAARAAGADAPEAEVKLIIDEGGYERWWVNIHAENADGVRQTQSYFIDPYGGGVWARAKPFEPKPADQVSSDRIQAFRRPMKLYDESLLAPGAGRFQPGATNQ